MKIFRVIATHGPYIKATYILAKNKKQAKELTFQYGFSNFLIDTVQLENANNFWKDLSETEQNQFKKALVNNFFKQEVL